jgi:triosephosphate isomerase
MSSSRSLPRLLVGVSLKLHLDLAQTREWLVQALAAVGTFENAARLDDAEVFVLPAFPALPMAQQLLTGSRLAYGAQDVHWAQRGAWTGEVSAGMLRELGAAYVAVGHAERRAHFAETDEIVAAKAAAAAAAGLTPVICVGETVRMAAAEAATVTQAQVAAALSALPQDAPVVLAYEPVWAIGAQQPAPAQHVRTVASALSHELSTRSGTARVIYGGTAGPGTWAALTAPADDRCPAPIHGLFLGRSALDPAGLRRTLTEVLDHHS